MSHSTVPQLEHATGAVHTLLQALHPCDAHETGSCLSDHDISVLLGVDTLSK